MAQVEEELSMDIPCQNFVFLARGGVATGSDKMEIISLTLTNAQAAALAWLTKQVDNTLLKLELKLADA